MEFPFIIKQFCLQSINKRRNELFLERISIPYTARHYDEVMNVMIINFHSTAYELKELGIKITTYSKEDIKY
jgi:hypothetical protein